MMKFNEVRTNNKQLENTFICYMIFASYFRKCVCRTERMAEKLLMYYKEMPVNKQESMEERAIAAADKALAEYAEVLSGSRCDAYIYREGSEYVLKFFTGLEKILVKVAKDGKYTVCVEA